MNQRLREKIALVAFILVVIGGFAGVIWYNINAGHQWNVAATRIDDAAGKMNGYATLAFDGVAIPTVDQAASTDAPVSLDATQSLYESKGSDVAKIDLVNPEKYANDMVIWIGAKRVGIFSTDHVLTDDEISEHVSALKSQNVDYTVCIATKSAYVDANAVSRNSSNGTRRNAQSDAASAANPSSTSSESNGSQGRPGSNGSNAASPPSQPSAASSRPLDSSARDATSNRTAEPSDRNASNSSTGAESSSQDSVALPSGETGIDIVITTDAERDIAQGRSVDGTYFVSAPYVGTCGIVVISPYNVVSSDVVTQI